MDLVVFFVNCTLTKTLQCANVVGVIEKADESEVECIDPGSWQHDRDVLGRLVEVHVEGSQCPGAAQVRARCKVVPLQDDFLDVTHVVDESNVIHFQMTASQVEQPGVGQVGPQDVDVDQARAADPFVCAVGPDVKVDQTLQAGHVREALYVAAPDH